MVTGLGGIAALGIGLSADAQFPGVGANLHVAGQADRAIREGQTGGDGSAERMSRIGEGAGSVRGLCCGGNLDIRFRLVNTLLSADPFGGSVLVVVAVAREAVADRAEGDAVLVVATLQTGQGLIVTFGMPEADGAQSMQVGIDVGEDDIIAFPGRRGLRRWREWGDGGAGLPSRGWFAGGRCGRRQ